MLSKMNENSRRVNRNAKCDFIQIGSLEVFLDVWTNGHQIIQDHIPRSETSDSPLCEPQILHSGNIMPVESPVIQGIGRLRSLTLNLLTTTIVAPPSNASKWQIEFNSAFKGLRNKR